MQVVVRIRPPLPRELNGFRPFENAVLVDPSRKVVTLSENLAALSNNGVENGIVSAAAPLAAPTAAALRVFKAAASAACAVGDGAAPVFLRGGCISGSSCRQAATLPTNSCTRHPCTCRHRSTTAIASASTACTARTAPRRTCMLSPRAQQCTTCCRWGRQGGVVCGGSGWRGGGMHSQHAAAAGVAHARPRACSVAASGASCHGFPS